MKRNNIIKFRFWLTFLLALPCCVNAFGSRLTFCQADSLLVLRNLTLRSAHMDISAAEGNLAQSSRYDNPTMSVMYNIQNPTNRRWFDPGRTGEIDVQFSQPFAIGGQHAELVKQDEALLRASRNQLSVTHRDLRTEVHVAMVDLYYQQRQATVYDEEIVSAEKILAAYREQTSRGNIAAIETQRIATMVYQLRKSRTDLLLEASALQARLRQMLMLDDDDSITVDINEQEAIDEASRLYIAVAGTPATAIETMPEMQLIDCQGEAAKHSLRWQRSQSLPLMSVQGEYDKNGSIGHNYFAVGLSVTVPLWNRNRGNIRKAQVAVEQAAVEADRQRNAIKQQRQADLDIVEQYLNQLAEPTPTLDSDISMMLHAAEKQFMSRHISLVEFVDLYDNYRDTMLARLDAKSKMLQAAERLKIIWGNVQQSADDERERTYEKK